MSFLSVPLFTMISHYLLPHVGFCKAYQNCLVAIIKLTTVELSENQTVFSSVVVSDSQLPAFIDSVQSFY